MIRICLFFLSILAFPAVVTSQNTLAVHVVDSVDKAPLPGVLVVLVGSGNGKATDANGNAKLTQLPSGDQWVEFRMAGYASTSVMYTFNGQTVTDTVELNIEVTETEEVVIEGTRSNRTIGNTPTRVEVLTEEIDEASTMDPSKVAHLLTHSTGIQVQQTSATSNSANVRIQGMDGRYTQILKDGFPIYGGFSGGLSVMQIPPLDLRQVEYVKGSASTLYGAGAISGLINLVSKEPVNGKSESIIHLNASHIGAFDVNAFTMARKDKFGFSLLAQRNTHRWFDADSDGYTDMPELTKYNLNPRFFVYFNDRTKMYAGATITNEFRQGGDVHLFGYRTVNNVNFYREINEVNRFTTQVKLDHSINKELTLTLRNSFNFFERSLLVTPSFAIGDRRFAGNQISSFSEASLTKKNGKSVLIAGLNFYSDYFKEEVLSSLILRDEEMYTVGAFINYSFDIGKMIAIESGLRTDYSFEEDIHILPRLSVLFKWTDKLSTRIGGGMGYRNATIFNQEAEQLAFYNVMPISRNITDAENSYGANADIGYKVAFGENYFISFNQMFFFTRLTTPIVLADTAAAGNSGVFQFTNADGYTQSYGAETFFKFGFFDFVFFAGYTYTNVRNHFGDTITVLTLTPTHSLKGDLLYALPGKWRIGADYEFKSAQKLSDGRESASYWTYGVVVEYTWKEFTLFGNVENFTNVRQTNFESLLTGPYNTPQFTDVWAPLDGIVFNAGIKIRL
jgi:iron complex outermembrane receptor protein